MPKLSAPSNGKEERIVDTMQRVLWPEKQWKTFFFSGRREREKEEEYWNRNRMQKRLSGVLSLRQTRQSRRGRRETRSLVQALTYKTDRQDRRREDKNAAAAAFHLHCSVLPFSPFNSKMCVSYRVCLFSVAAYDTAAQFYESTHFRYPQFIFFLYFLYLLFPPSRRSEFYDTRERESKEEKKTCRHTFKIENVIEKEK